MKRDTEEAKEADQDAALQRTARGEAGALEELLEKTCLEGYRRAGSEVALLEAYQCMLHHLDQVRPCTRFWDWFDQIAPAGRTGVVTAAPSGLAQRMLASLDRKPSPPVAPGGEQRLLSLLLSGFLPSLTTLLVTLMIVGSERGHPLALRLCSSLLAGFPLALLFTYSMGSTAKRWRASALARRPAFLPYSMLLCAVVLLWAPAAAALFSVGSLLLLGDGKAPGAGLDHLVALGLDRVANALSIAAMAQGWAAGVLSCLAGRWLFARHRWVTYDEARGLGGHGPFVALGAAILLWIGAALLWAGGQRLEPSLRQAYSSEPLPSLPQALVKHPAIVAWTENSRLPPQETRELRSAAVQLCLESLRSHWVGPAPWSKLEVRSLLHFVEQTDLTRHPAEGPDDIELALYTLCFQPERDGLMWDLGAAINASQLPTRRWTDWLNRAMLRSDSLLTGLPPTPQNMPLFQQAYRSLSARAETDFPTLVERDAFQRGDQRRALNVAWRAYKATNPPEQVPVPSPAELQARGYHPPDPDWNTYLADPRRAQAVGERQRHMLVYTVLLLELKRRQSLGLALPTNWDGLRPDVRALMLAYRDWLRLEPVSEGVKATLRGDSGHLVRTQIVKQP